MDFDAIDMEIRLRFLQEWVERDPAVKERLLRYASDSMENEHIDGEVVEGLVGEMRELIETYDAEEEYCECDNDGHDRYTEPWENEEEILDDLLLGFHEAMVHDLERANFLSAFAILLALYETARDDTIVVEDNYYGLFVDGVSDTLFSLFRGRYRHTFATSIQATPLPPSLRRKILSLLLERLDRTKLYRVGDLAEVLELVFDDQESGATLLAALREHQALHRESARFFVTLARRVGEEEYAYKVAESYYSVDASVAVLYLDMLWTSGEEERFIDASRTLIAKQDMYGAYLPGIIRHIDPQSTPELYVAVWKLYTQRTHSMEDYERLRPYLTQAERLRFIETLAMHKPFYLDLLNAEGEYTTLAKFARDEIRYGFHLPEALAYLAPHDPKEAWAIAVEYCEKLMGDRDRKRKTYQEMMRIFSALEASPAIRDDLRRYLTTLYHHQPKLPALRNEIKKRFGKMN